MVIITKSDGGDHCKWDSRLSPFSPSVFFAFTTVLSELKSVEARGQVEAQVLS